MIAKTQTKRFQGATAKEAESAAIAWSTDLSQHEALAAVESVDTLKKGKKFVATIVYRE